MTRRIEKLNIENLLGIKQITHVPITDFTEVRGGNGEGKSSFLAAIELLFGNRDATKHIKNPVRNGQKKATVSVELTDMIITKIFSESGRTRTEIISKEGAKFSNPIQMIERIFGKLPYDPLKMMEHTDKELIEIYLSLIDTEVDFNELEAQKKATYAERTIINRQKKDVEAKRNSYGLDYPDAPNEEVSVSELSSKLTEALATEEQHRIDIGTRKLNHESIESKKDEIERLNNEINQIIKMDDELLTKMNDYVDPDTAGIQDRIGNIEETNKQVRYMHEKDKLMSEYDRLRDKSEALTTELTDINDTKEYEIKNAKIPIDGVSFDDNGLTYEGVPVGQCSTAQRLWVALAISVGTHQATNGVKVMLIQHGNNLDKKSRKLVKEFCEKHEYQVWIEIVADEPSGTGIFIEDGEIKDE
jgi:DNA repair ATPase RecN